MRDMTLGTALLEFGAQISVDNTHQKNAGIAFHAGKYSLNDSGFEPVSDMFRGPDIRKRDTGSRDLMYRLARGVRHEMDMWLCVCHRVKWGLDFMSRLFRSCFQS